MSDRKVETMKVSGQDYAKVAKRSEAFHEDNPKCNVTTSYEVKEGHVIFSATVETKKGTFTGHSYGRVTGNKAFEKLETISVGRALAFAGYLASGDIACAEEMAEVVSLTQFNALKLKWAKANADTLEGVDRSEQGERFNAWCHEIIEEDTDFRDIGNWEPEWLSVCWHELNGGSEVPD